MPFWDVNFNHWSFKYKQNRIPRCFLNVYKFMHLMTKFQFWHTMSYYRKQNLKRIGLKQKLFPQLFVVDAMMNQGYNRFHSKGNILECLNGIDSMEQTNVGLFLLFETGLIAEASADAVFCYATWHACFSRYQHRLCALCSANNNSQLLRYCSKLLIWNKSTVKKFTQTSKIW